MRTFISIDVPEEVKEKIKEIQDKLPGFRGKKTELENLHLTLKFLGEVGENKIKEVKKRLEGIEFDKFETEIDSVGVFSEDFIKIVWLHLTNCDELQKQIDEKLEDLFGKEKRFMSHLTIARVKTIENKNEFLEKIKKMKISKIKFQANAFKLKKSILTEKGPVYETIETYHLN